MWLSASVQEVFSGLSAMSVEADCNVSFVAVCVSPVGVHWAECHVSGS